MEDDLLIPFVKVEFHTNSPGYSYHLIPEFNYRLFLNLNITGVAENLIENAQNHFRNAQNLPRISFTKRMPAETNEYKIYITWLGIWCGTLWYHHPQEKMFRLEQVFDVLGIMTFRGIPPTLDIFQLIMQTSFKHGTPEMVVKTYEMMLSGYNLKPNAGIMALLFKSIALNNSQDVPNPFNPGEFNPSSPDNSLVKSGSESSSGSSIRIPNASNNIYIGKPSGLGLLHSKTFSLNRKTEFKIIPDRDKIIVKVEEPGLAEENKGESPSISKFKCDGSSLRVRSKYYLMRTSSLKKRTFLTNRQLGYVQGEDISIRIVEECAKCKAILKVNDVRIYIYIYID